MLYKREKLVTQADALLQPKTLGHTIELLEEQITMFPCDNTIQKILAAVLFYLDISEYAFPAHVDATDPLLVPITSAKIPRQQKHNSFCRVVVTNLHTGKEMASLNGKMGILFWFAHGDEQMIVSNALLGRLLLPRHYANHPILLVAGDCTNICIARYIDRPCLSTAMHRYVSALSVPETASAFVDKAIAQKVFPLVPLWNLLPITILKNL